jgi:Cd2+/Zn2+-exporting ATPase
MKLQLILEGLDCSVCALKIEKEVGEINQAADVSLDFVNKTLTMDIPSEHKDKIIEQATKIVHNHEPSVVVTEKSQVVKKPKISSRMIMDRVFLAVGGLVFITGLILELPIVYEFVLFFAAYLLIGYSVIFKAVRNIIKGEIFDENFLMFIATVGAFAIGEYPEGAAVMLFYQIGELFQSLAVNRSRRSITSLLNIRPEYANLKIGDDYTPVPPEKVSVGDIILVKAGERVPLDGRVISGSASLDNSALTGESIPYDVSEGSEVLSGSVNLSGLLTIEVTKPFGESAVSKILDLVQNAAAKKARTENFITRFAKFYTPVVVFSAFVLAVIPPLIIPGAEFIDWINRALVFLVVSCPCALVVSVPLSYFGGIGGASRSGILVKGSNFLDALTQVDTVVFDKTGTLTKGVFRVSKIQPAAGWSEDQLLTITAHAESFSPHPIALSVLKAFTGKIDSKRITDSQVISGKGVCSTVDGDEILAGNGSLMDSYGIKYPKEQIGLESGTVVYIAVNRVFAGYILIEDEVKPDSVKAVEELKLLGVKNIVMLTGDRMPAAKKTADMLELDGVHSDLLPHQKVEMVEKLMEEKSSSGKLVFVGDGINDAPVLARADIGVAMGALGSDAAIEAADVVLMTDQPSKVATALKIAAKTRRVVLQNIVFALSVKLIILVLGAFGMATMWAAVFGDVGVTLIAVLNAMRTIKTMK